MKKRLCFVLSILFLISLLPHTALAAEKSGTLGENIQWVLEDDGTLVLTGTGAMRDFRPAGVSDFRPWDAIASEIKAVRVSKGITALGVSAFRDFPELVSAELPEGLAHIGDHSFYRCEKLTTIALPSTLKSIGWSAFAQCDSLAALTLPASLTNIGNLAFNETALLATEDGWTDGIFYKDGWVLAAKPELVSGALVLPDTVKHLIAYAFTSCTELLSVTLPAKLTEIPVGAFDSCYKLKSVYLPYGITAIGGAAFYGCAALEDIFIPSTVTALGDLTSVGSNAFAHCSTLKSITLPATVREVGKAAFYDCAALAEVKVTNPDCVFDLGVFGSNTTVYGYAGSTAEAYTRENEIPFAPLTDLAVTGDTLKKAGVAHVYVLPEMPVEDVYAAIPDVVCVTDAVGAAVDTAGKVTSGMILKGAAEGVSYAPLTVVVPGDIDMDGDITASDARLALRSSVALETLSLDQTLAADVDGSPAISAEDARCILRASVSLETPADWLARLGTE